MTYNTLYTMTKATQNPLSDGGVWTSGDFNPLQILDSDCVGTAGSYGTSWYDGATDFTPDQFVQFTVTAIAAVIDIKLRYRPSFLAGYELFFSHDAWEVKNPFGTVLGDSSGVFQTGDVILFSCAGSTISLFQNGNALLSATDSYSDYDGVPYVSITFSSTPLDTGLTNFIAGSVTNIIPSVPTRGTIAPGQYSGTSFANAFINPSQMDVFQIADEGGTIVWNLNYAGVATVNPTNPTNNVVIGKYPGSSFEAYMDNSNPNNLDVLQVRSPRGGAIAWWLDYQGVAHA